MKVLLLQYKYWDIMYILNINIYHGTYTIKFHLCENKHVIEDILRITYCTAYNDWHNVLCVGHLNFIYLNFHIEVLYET